MTASHPFNNQKAFRFLDHSKSETIFNVPNTAMASFAIDDAIATAVGNNIASATVRMWVHEPTIVLGIPDSRLPYIEEGIQFIKRNNMNAVIRNSGGLAVFLDHGVLNMSLIVPNNRHVNIHDGYHMMYRFIQEVFSEYTDDIKAFEIEGSYCPGDYDLSIGGIKFAGISQRRVRNGVAIQIYLDIEGNSHERAAIVREFYQISKKNIATKHIYPDINPDVMGTISELLGIPFTVNMIIDRIKQLLIKDYHLISDSLTEEERGTFFRRLEQMKQRNEKINA